MPIGFGRVEFIKRSEGRNACQLSSYLSRSRIFFEGNCALDSKLYDFSHRETVSHHEIILPDGADENLKIPEVLWNLAERKEVRKDAQVSMHLVLALPDDKEITLKDRIELTRTFIQKQYPGLVAECVIHPPERKIEFTEENKVLGIPKGTIGTVMEEKEGNYIVSLPKGIRANPFVEIGTSYIGMSLQEHNWHAHAQLTTRRLKENGCEFEDKKATDLMPVIKKGKVVSGPDVGKLWAQHQNEFFLSKGLALKVDENGLIPQEHLGPVRMRGRAFALLEEHQKRLELNEIAASDPQNILKVITKRQSVFNKEDVERFMLKHVPSDKVQRVREGFWKLEELVQLRSLETKEFVSKFTSEDVIAEEEQILRLADRIHNKPQKSIGLDIQNTFTQGLSKEQKKAYHHILDGEGVSCIQGYAGTGKSYLLKSLKEAYEDRGLIVRSFGPDNATANVLKGKGFFNAENVYRFLFSAKYGLRNTHKGFEVWVLDEAGKLGNQALNELCRIAHANKAKLVLAGDSAQMPSVDRGGMFQALAEKYNASKLHHIERQSSHEQRSMAQSFAEGNIEEAADTLRKEKCLNFERDKSTAMEKLIVDWSFSHYNDESKSYDKSLILATSNREVHVLNQAAHDVRMVKGELKKEEYSCKTMFGEIRVSEGDFIEFRKNDRECGVTNGLKGEFVKAEEDRFVVKINQQKNDKRAKIVSFDPKEYGSWQLAYATTTFRSQGRTVEDAYVLHSPLNGKQTSYVAMSRHRENISVYIDKEECSSFKSFQEQCSKNSLKESTLYFHNEYDLKKQHERDKIDRTIWQEKSSLSKWKKMKAYGREFKGSIQDMADHRRENKADKQDNHAFYQNASTKKLDTLQYGVSKLPEVKIHGIEKQAMRPIEKDLAKQAEELRLQEAMMQRQTMQLEKLSVYQDHCQANDLGTLKNVEKIFSPEHERDIVVLCKSQDEAQAAQENSKQKGYVFLAFESGNAVESSNVHDRDIDLSALEDRKVLVWGEENDRIDIMEKLSEYNHMHVRETCRDFTEEYEKEFNYALHSNPMGGSWHDVNKQEHKLDVELGIEKDQQNQHSFELSL